MNPLGEVWVQGYSEMRGGQDELIGDLKNQFEVLKADIANWNSSALNGTQTLDEII